MARLDSGGAGGGDGGGSGGADVGGGDDVDLNIDVDAGEDEQVDEPMQQPREGLDPGDTAGETTGGDTTGGGGRGPGGQPDVDVTAPDTGTEEPDAGTQEPDTSQLEPTGPGTAGESAEQRQQFREEQFDEGTQPIDDPEVQEQARKLREETAERLSQEPGVDVEPSELETRLNQQGNRIILRAGPVTARDILLGRRTFRRQTFGGDSLVTNRTAMDVGDVLDREQEAREAVEADLERDIFGPLSKFPAVDLQPGQDFTVERQGRTIRAVPTEQLEQDLVVGSREAARSRLLSQIEERTGADLDFEDIEIQEKEGRLTAELSAEGEERVAVQTTPLRDVPIAGGITTTVERGRVKVLQATDPISESFRGAFPTQEELLGVGTVGVATPEPITTGAGALVIGGTAATAASAKILEDLGAFDRPKEVGETKIRATNLEASEIEVPTDGESAESELPVSGEVEQRPELGVPGGEPTSATEVSVPSTGLFIDELEVSGFDRTTRVGLPGQQEVGDGTPVAPGDRGESVVPDEFPEGGGPRPIAEAKQVEEGVVGRQIDEEETQPTIEEEDISQPLGEPEQAPPSTRERQRREDLDVFEREFPTGAGAVVGRSVTQSEEQRLRQAQQPGILQSTSLDVAQAEALDIGLLAEQRPVADTLTRVDVATAQRQATQTAQQQRLDTLQEFQFGEPTQPVSPGFINPPAFVTETVDVPAFGDGPPVSTPSEELRADISSKERDDRRERRFFGGLKRFSSPVASPEEVLTGEFEPVEDE